MNLSFIRTKRLAHQVGVLDRYIEEVLLSRGTVMSHGTLDEVTRVVEFVRVDFLPLVRAPPSTQARTFISDASGEVAIGLLSLCDDGNHGVEVVVETGIVVHGERVTGTLDYLVGVGVVEGEVAFVLTLDETGGQREIVETAVHLTLMEGRGDAHRAIGLDAGRPETIAEVDTGKGNLLNGIRKT